VEQACEVVGSLLVVMIGSALLGVAVTRRTPVPEDMTRAGARPG
jgi:hypothetical protein